MSKFTNWYGMLWKKILPHYWDTFWRTQYIYGENWCWFETELIKKNHLKQEIKKIEQDIWDNSMNHNYYPPAA